MRCILIAIFLLIVFYPKNVRSQIDSTQADSLAQEFVDDWDSIGLVIIKPNSMIEGQWKEIFNSMYPRLDSDTVVFQKKWTVTVNGVPRLHRRFNQFHNGVLVEGCNITEMLIGGYVRLLYGQIGEIKSHLHRLSQKALQQRILMTGLDGKEMKNGHG